MISSKNGKAPVKFLGGKAGVRLPILILEVARTPMTESVCCHPQSHEGCPLGHARWPVMNKDQGAGARVVEVIEDIYHQDQPGLIVLKCVALALGN